MGNDRLAARLKELRRAKGYTQEYVASVLGVVRQAYGHYENGRRTPEPAQLYALAKLYKVSVDDLMSLAADGGQDCEETARTAQSQELSDYLSFMNSPDIAEALKHLTANEKEMIYYFRHLTKEDQEDFIAFARIRAGRARKK